MRKPIECKICRRTFSPKSSNHMMCSNACRLERARIRGQSRRPPSKEQATAWHHKSRLKIKYGMTTQDYDNMLIAQQGRCYICGDHDCNGRGLMVDHCHASDLVRKLLCMRCNTALGLANDSVDTLFNMIDYLTEHN